MHLRGLVSGECAVMAGRLVGCGVAGSAALTARASATS